MAKKLTKEQELEHPEVKPMMEDLDKVSSLSALSENEGGKVLVSSLMADVLSDVESLCVKYSSMTMQEFVATCADMKTRIDLARVLSRARVNKKYIEEMIEQTLLQ